MFSKEQRTAYRNRAKVGVFSHIFFSVWAVMCSDFLITLVTGFYSAMAEQKNINILSPDLEMLTTTAIVMLLAELVNYPLAFCARRGFFLLSRRSYLEPISAGEIFAPFSSVGFLLKGTLIMLLNSLLVYLASIPMFIFVLPVSYAYCMAVFIFLDNDSISPIKALTLSRHMMKGRKWGAFLTTLPLVLLQAAVTLFLGGLPLLATLITSVIQAVEFVTLAVIYNEIISSEIKAE